MPDEIVPIPSAPPAIKITWILGLIAAFLIFVVIATYSSLMAKHATNYDETRRTERLAILDKQRQGDAQILTTADWIDRTKGTVHIPIDEAIPEAIADLKAKPVQMGAAIAGTAPAAPPAAPAVAENKAPASSPAAPATNAAPPAQPAPAAPNK